MIVEDLRVHPAFGSLVADRIWRAWWEPSGAALADVEDALGAVIAEESFPFTLIARSGDRFAGTVTAIQSERNVGDDCLDVFSQALPLLTKR